MLTSVQITRFRSCEEVVLDNIGRILALVGRNGAGKSNILKAIAVTAADATGNDSRFAGLNLSRPGSASLKFELESVTYEYTATFPLHRRGISTAQRHERVEKLTYIQSGETSRALFDRDGNSINLPGRPEPLRVAGAISAMQALIALLPPEDAMLRLIHPARTFLANIRYYPEDQEPERPRTSGGILSLDLYNKWREEYEKSGDGGASIAMRILHMFLTRKEDFQLLQDLLGVNGLGLVNMIRVNELLLGGVSGDGKGEKSESTEKYYSIRYILAGHNRMPRQLPYRELSSGTRRVITILAEMIFDRNSVMLLEQPEDSLHPGLTTKVTGTLAANADGQIIVASHSAALMNAVKPEQVRLVTLGKKGTKARALDDRERAAATDYITREGSLAEFLQSVEE